LDYVAHGSDQHAAMLGLVKAEKDDEPQQGGWALQDITLYGPTATDKFLAQVLRQKIGELMSGAPQMQSTDPLAPHYAPRMWKP